MKRHPFDPFSFVFGISFMVLGLVLLNGRIDFADISGSTMLPLPLIFVGLLLGAMAISRIERPERADEPDEPDDPDRAGSG